MLKFDSEMIKNKNLVLSGMQVKINYWVQGSRKGEYDASDQVESNIRTNFLGLDFLRRLTRGKQSWFGPFLGWLVYRELALGYEIVAIMIASFISVQVHWILHMVISLNESRVIFWDVHVIRNQKSIIFDHFLGEEIVLDFMNFHFRDKHSSIQATKSSY